MLRARHRPLLKMNNVKAILAGLLAVAIAAAAAWITAANLIEAYGSGPPYYGQTTNMDKWESPILFLLVLDGIAVLLVALLGRLAWRAFRLNADQAPPPR